MNDNEPIIEEVIDDGEAKAEPLPFPNRFIMARRATKAHKKAMREWPFKTYLLPCHRCALQCIIAQSSKDELDKSVERGEAWQVVCDDCAAELPGATAITLMTEAQAKELQRANLATDAIRRRN